jgi:hypothetical protein
VNRLEKAVARAEALGGGASQQQIVAPLHKESVLVKDFVAAVQNKAKAMTGAAQALGIA